MTDVMWVCCFYHRLHMHMHMHCGAVHALPVVQYRTLYTDLSRSVPDGHHCQCWAGHAPLRSGVPQSHYVSVQHPTYSKKFTHVQEMLPMFI